MKAAAKLLTATVGVSLCVSAFADESVRDKGFHWLKSEDGAHVASGIQLNEQFMVTARHVDFLTTPGVTCNTPCDLQFVRNRLDDGTVWRDGLPGEKVTLVGVIPGQGVVRHEGRLTNVFRPLEKDGVVYQVVEGVIEKGMSGGPVYGDDGAVLGMIVAKIEKESFEKIPPLKDMENAGLMITTHEIRKQWTLLGLEDIALSVELKRKAAAQDQQQALDQQL